jgi:hypothetical protein
MSQLTKEHRDMANICVHTSLRNVSKMSCSTLQGCGVLVDAKGEIMSGIGWRARSTRKTW